MNMVITISNTGSFFFALSENKQEYSTRHKHKRADKESDSSRLYEFDLEDHGTKIIIWIELMQPRAWRLNETKDVEKWKDAYGCRV